jgi:hypothetical protein
MQEHLFVGGEIAAHGGIVDPGAVGDPSQRHRRDTGLQGWRARGFYNRRRTLALLFRAGALEGELRHRHAPAHGVMCGCVAEHRYRAFTHVVCITIPFHAEKDPVSWPPAWFDRQDQVALPGCAAGLR